MNKIIKLRGGLPTTVFKAVYDDNGNRLDDVIEALKKSAGSGGIDPSIKRDITTLQNKVKNLEQDIVRFPYFESADNTVSFGSDGDTYIYMTDGVIDVFSPYAISFNSQELLFNEEHLVTESDIIEDERIIAAALNAIHERLLKIEES